MKPQDSFAFFFADGLRVFREFLRGEFSDENIEFWIACQQYKSLEVGDHSKAEAQKIYNEFIAFQSLREVNLDCETRLQTESRLAEAEPDLFDACQKRIEALMEKDPYIRFLRSALYYKLKEVTGVSVADSAHQTSGVLDCGNIKQMGASSPLNSDIPLVLSLPQNSIPSPQVAWKPPSDRVCTDVLDKALIANFDKKIALQAPYSPLLDAIVLNSLACTPSTISLRDKTRANHGQNRHSIDLSDMVIQ
ncbi:unnamed protein product [Dibothriocephalus latus]|uniref:RGS domain-containing protein n=1 Tax=Dibothriocephalus latus TaxID=60516 RepID=A0A3P7LG31_DIBLA|nr:unnamed protein product [Dibothriocephalus latus]